MEDEDFFDDAMVEEMSFPLGHGYSLYVLRKYCNTDDEKFLCTLYGKDNEIIPMDDSSDEISCFEVETVKAYHPISVALVIENASSLVDRLTQERCPTCKQKYR